MFGQVIIEAAFGYMSSKVMFKNVKTNCQIY